MPRPKPPEQLFSYNVRLTRSQIRKIESMGGPDWLRRLISKTQATHCKRDPVDYIRNMKARNWAIARSTKTSDELAALYKLSRQRVNAIKRAYAVDLDIKKHVQQSNI